MPSFKICVKHFNEGSLFVPPTKKTKQNREQSRNDPSWIGLKYQKEAVIQGFSLKYLFYLYLGNSRGGVHFQWSCRYYVCRFSGGGLLRGWFLSILFFYCVNCCFWGNCPQWLVHTFKYTFHFNLHGRKALGRALLAGGFLVNISYCISSLLHSNSALVIYRAFLHRWLIHWHNAFINLQLL